MNDRNLLIVGAGAYADVAFEIASDMGCFNRIDFVDDNKEETPNGHKVAGKVKDIEGLCVNYTDIVVAIGNPKIRLSFLEMAKRDTKLNVATLISPRAYVSSSALVKAGCILEPMAVVHSGCALEEGCIVSAGAVVNHSSNCGRGVHVDCNAVVAGYTVVPAETKICFGEVYTDK